MLSSIKEASKDTLIVNNNTYYIYSLSKAAQYLGPIDKLPKSIKIILENLLRNQNNHLVNELQLRNIVSWLNHAHAEGEIIYHPTRVLMQDFTGVPAIVDLASMREAVLRLGGRVEKINPVVPIDLIIDHSIMVDNYGNQDSYKKNSDLEMLRNIERYSFLRWGQKVFDRFRVIPPRNGICHQINLEYLAQIVWNEQQNGQSIVYPDTLIGTDSHTTMINSLGILGWGVGGLEAEGVILGQPISMLIPDVVGLKLTGTLNPGITATDLVLTITKILRSYGVVGQFIEFYGDGLSNLPLTDRATIANMAPEYGATCSFFPIDDITLDYLRFTGRNEQLIALVESYSKKQGLWRNPGDKPIFTRTLELNMQEITTSIAGPKRPQDLVKLSEVPKVFMKQYNMSLIKPDIISKNHILSCQNDYYTLDHGSIVIAAITSCTNTSNANILITAGLLARNAVQKKLHTKPWVKTSLAPGSRVVIDYLIVTGLMPFLDQLGFNLVGYGCTTCIGNSGSLKPNIEEYIRYGNLNVSAVLSGNRNFEGRIHPLVKNNWLASPPLVIAYALVGSILVNLNHDALGVDIYGKPIYLSDIWPSTEEVMSCMKKINSDMFCKVYQKIFIGDHDWHNIKVNTAPVYKWDQSSTYIRLAPFFDNMSKEPKPIINITNAFILAILGDSITTDHISPAGSIKKDSPAGKYLQQLGIDYKDFNSYGSRRGNHEVMIRGTFANIRIRNEMLCNIEGGYTRHIPSGDILNIYDAAMRYLNEEKTLVVIAGKEYGSGSSRDWAAKGTRLLGIRVIIAESFERIHRSNLINMGILPLEFLSGENRKTLKLTGDENINLLKLQDLSPRCHVPIVFIYSNGYRRVIKTICRIDTKTELKYFLNDGILQYVIRTVLT